MARGSWGCGYRAIELITTNDEVLSRDEFDPNNPLAYKRVEELFVRQAFVLNLHVGGRVIGTTSEHPFYAYGRGWTPAGELDNQDWLLSDDCRWLPVEEVFATGELQTVYNLRVADYHTYFVGDEGWGFAAWAHNTYVYVSRGTGGRATYFGITGDFVRRLGEHARKARGIEKIIGLTNVTRRQARAAEHLLILKYGRRGIDPGGILDNVNRGIDPRKLWKYENELEWARKMIEHLGL